MVNRYGKSMLLYFLLKEIKVAKIYGKNHEKCCPISTIVILRLMILQLTKAVAENISMTSKTITFKILQSAIKLRPSMQLISL